MTKNLFRCCHVLFFSLSFVFLLVLKDDLRLSGIDSRAYSVRRLATLVYPTIWKRSTRSEISPFLHAEQQTSKRESECDLKVEEEEAEEIGEKGGRRDEIETFSFLSLPTKPKSRTFDMRVIRAPPPFLTPYSVHARPTLLVFVTQ